MKQKTEPDWKAADEAFEEIWNPTVPPRARLALIGALVAVYADAGIDPPSWVRPLRRRLLGYAKEGWSAPFGQLSRETWDDLKAMVERGEPISVDSLEKIRQVEEVEREERRLLKRYT